MARYLVATHTADVTRDWLCAGCHAFGHATVQARGEGERRVWIRRDAAADVAHQRAAAALERDADRIVALIRCPACRERAPGAALATLWHARSDIWTGLGMAALVGLLVFAKTRSLALPVALAAFVFVVMIAIGRERQRWSAAARAHLAVSSRRPAPAQRVSTPAISAAPDANPFRAPPSPPVIAVVRPPTHAPAPIVAGDPSDKPTFLH